MITDRTLAKKASQVYAEVLLGAVSGFENIVEASNQLETAYRTIVGSLELRDVLSDRRIDMLTRQNIVQDLFEGYEPALLTVLKVMIERNDIQLLGRVKEVYVDLVERELDSVFIDVTTVVELDESLRDRIRKKYSAQFGKGVLLREHIDPSLVGGIVLSTHGRRIDASVVSQLENARLVLSTVPSGGGR
jgi:F-type H+-transporting ATPase subunit delta